MYNFFKSVLISGRFYFLLGFFDRTISFIIFLLLARTFSSELYGQIVTVFVFAGILATILDFGLPVHIQREASKGEKLSGLYKYSLQFKLLLTIFYVIGAIITLPLLYNEIPFNIIAIIIGINLFLSLGNLIQFFLFGKDDSKYVFYFFLISKILSLVIIIYSYLLFQNIYLFLVGYLIGSILQFILLLRHLKYYDVKPLKIVLDTDQIKKTLITVLPLGLITIFNVLYDKIDIVILPFFVDFNQVAQYNVAYTSYRLIVLLMIAINVPAFNLFSKNSLNVMILSELFRKYLMTLLVVTIISMLMYYFIFPDLLVFVFGEKYLQASSILSILSFSILFLTLNNLEGVFLNGIGKSQHVLIATFFGVLVNIILNFILIPKIGVSGAVYSTIVTEFVIFLIELFFVVRFFNSYNSNLSLNRKLN